MRIATITLLLLLTGCWDDAKHLNPLDPLAPDFVDAGAINGIVSDRAFNPLDGVSVSLVPGGRTTITSAIGEFDFQLLPPGQYSITVSRPDLALTIDTATVALAKSTVRNFSLNILPTVAALYVQTTHVSRWWPQDDLYRLDVTAMVSDGDGLVDISDVMLSIPFLNLEVPLQPTTEPGSFAISLAETDLNGASLHELSGRDLHASVSDQFGSATQSDPTFISRIIDFVPETISPSGSQSVPGGSPLLSWQSADLPYAGTYQIDVFRVDDNVATNVYSMSDIPASQLTVQVSETFEIGQYYWTVSVVDEYGNRSRSKESGFIVP